MSQADLAKWDTRYRDGTYHARSYPSPFLETWLARIPGAGRALDVACGAGRNAVFLADLGCEVDAIDISPVELAKARALAAERYVNINTIEADLEHYDLGVARYDVIVNVNYLQRSLQLVRALKPNGWLFFQTFTDAAQEGPRRAEFRLRPGELRAMFADLEIHAYHEGERATLIALKRALH